MMDNQEEISSSELNEKFAKGDDFFIIDLRDPEDFGADHIPNSILIPLAELEEHLDDFDPSAEFVIHCKMGGKSVQAIDSMKEKGFQNVKVLSGGIQHWNLEKYKGEQHDK